MVVEYALILAVIITVSAVAIKQLVGRDGGPNGDNGAIVNLWSSIIRTIAKDEVDPP